MSSPPRACSAHPTALSAESWPAECEWPPRLQSRGWAAARNASPAPHHIYGDAHASEPAASIRSDRTLNNIRQSKLSSANSWLSTGPQVTEKSASLQYQPRSKWRKFLKITRPAISCSNRAIQWAFFCLTGGGPQPGRGGVNIDHRPHN